MIMRAAARRAREHTWAVVLAGGVGSRLRGCTSDRTGHHVPKQYCLIDGEHTLLQLAIARAHRLVEPARVLAVVLTEHCRWWEPQLKGIVPPENVVAQPLERGTAVGMLLPLLLVLARDPEAHVIVLPADHHFRHEGRLARALLRALEHTFDEPDTLVFVGVEPESPTSDFGYLVPHEAGEVDPRPLASFVEKPSPADARKLILQGALWNTLILAARGRCVLSLIRRRYPEAADALRGAVVLAEEPLASTRALEAIYPGLSRIDLSRDVLECSDCPMAVTPASGVGWSELGTPERVTAFSDEVHASGLAALHPPPLGLEFDPELEVYGDAEVDQARAIDLTAPPPVVESDGTRPG